MADPHEWNPRRGRRLAFAVIAVLFVIGIVQVLSGNSGFVTTEIDGERLGVCGTYGDPVFLELEDITQVQLTDTFDFGTCVEGEEIGKTVSGIYLSQTLGQYMVHAYVNVSSYIIVTYSGGILVFNCGSVSNTEAMYAKLIAAAPSE